MTARQTGGHDFKTSGPFFNGVLLINGPLLDYHLHRKRLRLVYQTIKL
ncbi:hypothetical protein [Peptoniphilus olsenii]